LQWVLFLLTATIHVITALTPVRAWKCHRLRRKLSEYYEGEGASRKRANLAIPAGSYTPVFSHVEVPNKSRQPSFRSWQSDRKNPHITPSTPSIVTISERPRSCQAGGPLLLA